MPYYDLIFLKSRFLIHWLLDAISLRIPWVERVVALVSRVQGTYEFEVQPLREYFAARYLYETAPYSPPGAECKGTKPDRFEAIAKNFYWLNVTRFYAGCFSKGELPALVDLLQVLAQTEHYRNTSYPRVLASMLLSDWVFTQNQRSMRAVIKIILDGLGLRAVAISNDRQFSSGNALVLPDSCGREELIDECFTILRSQPALDYSREITELIRKNSNPKEIKNRWYQETLQTRNVDRTLWLEYGLYLGSLSEINTAEIENILADDPLNSKRLILLFRARHITFCESSDTRSRIIIEAILNRSLITPLEHRSKSILDTFIQALNFVSHINRLFKLHQQQIYSKKRISELEFSIKNRNVSETSSVLLEKCLETIENINKSQQFLIKDWLSQLTPWDTLIEELRSIWGDKWIFFHLANLASSVNTTKAMFQDFFNLLDHSVSLCKRCCYARSKARTADWWKKQFNTATTESELMFISLLLLTWGSPSTIVSLLHIIDNIFCQLATEEFQRLVRSIKAGLSFIKQNTHKGTVNISIEAMPDNLSERTFAAFGICSSQQQAENIYSKYLSDYRGSDPIILEFCQEAALNLAINIPSYWQHALAIIATSYAKGIDNGFAMSILMQDTDNKALPVEVAKEITDHPEKYPRRLVSKAEARCRENLTSEIIPVGVIAQRDEWFDLQS